MVAALNFKDPKSAIGAKVRQGGDTLEIIGVLENYHQMSLKEQVTPLVYRYTPQFASYFSFTVESGNYLQMLCSLEQTGVFTSLAILWTFSWTRNTESRRSMYLKWKNNL